MNADRKSSAERNMVPEADGDEQQQAARPLVANVDLHRPRRLRFIPENTMRTLGISLLVIACLIPLALSRFKQANNHAGPIVPAARAEMVTVTARELYHEIKIVGKLDYGDGQIVHVTAPITGRIERVETHSAGDRITEREKLVSIKSEPLLDGERRLLKALEASESAKWSPDSLTTNSTEDSLWAARRKLLLVGVLPDQLAEIEQSRTVDGQLAVDSRSAGVLLETRVRVGQQVRQGDVLYRIAKPDPMWLYFNVPVRDMPWVSLGRRVHVNVQATPAETFPALVTVVSPVVDLTSQTVRIGVPLPNPDVKLERFMAANGTIRVGVLSDGTPESTGLEGKYICSTHPEFVQDTAGDCPKAGLLLAHVPVGLVRQKPAIRGKALAVPVTVVLDRNGHKLVRRLSPNGQMEMVEIKVGPMAQGRDERGQEANFFPVQAGLKEGDRVFVTPKEPRHADTLVARGGQFFYPYSLRDRVRQQSQESWRIA